MMRILYLSRWFPYPPDNGSKIRIFNLIKHLASRHEVDLVSFTLDPVHRDSTAALRPYCQKVEVTQYKAFRPGRMKALLGYFSRHPRSMIDTYSREMQALIERTMNTRSPDLVIASQVDMAYYAQRINGCPKILEELELTGRHEQFINQRQPIKKLRYGLSWWKLSKYIADLLRSFDGCTVVSERELMLVSNVAPDFQPIVIMPNGVDLSLYGKDYGPPEPDTLVYAGSLTYSANFDAMDFFLREIFPRVQAARADVKLFITGSLSGVPVDSLPHRRGVVLTDYLDDVRPLIARSWASVVPLRYGGGTRLKILESLALRTPVVTTLKGAEGLDLTAGRDLLIAEQPEDFARALVRLLADPELRRTLGNNGVQAVEAQYNWSNVGSCFHEFIEEVVKARSISEARWH